MVTSPTPTLASLFREFSRWKLVDEFWPRLDACVASLSDEQVWWRPNEASNSIGNLMLHLKGNVQQWLVVPFNAGEDHRNRPAEFAQRERIPVSELREELGATMRQAGEVLAKLSEPQLVAKMEIQGYATTGMGAVYQVVEHFGMHYGQIVYITKMLSGEDLGFYRELSTTGRPDKPRNYGRS